MRSLLSYNDTYKNDRARVSLRITAVVCGDCGVRGWGGIVGYFMVTVFSVVKSNFKRVVTPKNTEV